MVHFNNAGSALPPQVVVDTVIDHLRREAEIGGYEASAEAAEREEAVYTSIADLISAPSSQIALIENATRAWDMAVYGYPFRAGDRVLTARAEYASNVIAFLQLRDRFGIEIVLVDDDEHGQISLGLGAAVDYALALGPDSTWVRIEALGATLRERLVEVDGVTVQDKGERRGGIVTFAVADRTADEVTAGLTAAGINTSVSPAEWAHFDLPERGLPALVRASVHYYNTDEEVDRLVRWLREAPWSY